MPLAQRPLPLWIEIQSLPSTNSWLKDHGKSFTSPICLRAISQSAGRGRNSRSWIQNPRQDLAMSIGFFVAPHLSAQIPQLPLYTAAITQRWLKEKGLDLQIKWPNDLFFGNDKVGGILCEALWQKEQVYFIIGLGLNVYGDFTEYQKEFLARGIAEHLPQRFSLSELWKEWSDAFLKDIPQYFEKGLTPWLKELNNHLAFRDELLKLEWTDGHHPQTLCGRIRQIESNGQLSVELSNGEMRKFSHGELRILPPNQTKET